MTTGSFSLQQQGKPGNCITYQNHSPGRQSAQSTFQIQLLFHVGLNKEYSVWTKPPVILLMVSDTQKAGRQRSEKDQEA